MDTAPKATEALARRIRAIRYDALPPAVVTVARQCVLDWIAVTLRAVDEPLVAMLVDQVGEEGGHGQASLVGREGRVSARQAALVNGAASHALDYDDVNIRMTGHPTVAVLPAALALGQGIGANGKDLIAAFVAGYETTCLIGAMVAPGHYARGFHVTGTVGTFGAAAACAHLLGLGHEQTMTALGIAGTQAAGLKSMFGTMCKPLHAGKACESGLLAAQLAGRGFTSRLDIIECAQGFAATQTDSFDPGAALDADPDRYNLLDNLFKYHASCYQTHAAIEAIRSLRAEHGFAAADVERIVLHQDAGADTVCNIARPSSGLETKFSLRMLAAYALLDMTLMLAGPYASMLLADHGAEVIKIEPLEGDYVRSVGPYRPDDTLHAFGGYFQSVNRNKLSIALNLKEPEALDIMIELVKGADVLIENYRTGVMDRLGLSYETLHAANPRLVYAAVRGFGDPRTGSSPYVNWPAYDVIAQAMGGIMGITGESATEPTKIGPGVGDIVPAILCAFGVLAAVYRARETGQGQFVDVSMVDSVLALCERIVYQHSYEQKVPGPEGQRHPFLTPFGIVPCKDGHITLACHTDALWTKLCGLISRPEMANDPRLKTEAARRQHSDLVYGIVSEFTRQRSKSELLAELGGQVPFSPVYTVAEIATDPHFAARNMLVELDHPGAAGRMAVAGVPVKMSETPGGVWRRAPLLSEHADQLLAEIGIDAARMQSLRERRVVG